MVRYCVVFGMKDVANRFLPMGEFYLRGADLEHAKEIMNKIPEPPTPGNFVIRLSERYYDKQLNVDMNYEKTAYSREADKQGLYDVLDQLIKMQEQAVNE